MNVDKVQPNWATIELKRIWVGPLVVAAASIVNWHLARRAMHSDTKQREICRRMMSELEPDSEPDQVVTGGTVIVPVVA